MLPPTDQRFLDATDEIFQLEYWAWAFAENPKLAETAFTDDYEETLNAMEAEANAAAEAREAKRAAAEAAAAVIVTQEVVSGPVPVAEEWQDEVNDRFTMGAGGLS